MRGSHCYWCKEEELQPVPFQWLEWPLLLFAMRPYMCCHCFRRYYRVIVPWHGPVLRPPDED